MHLLARRTGLVEAIDRRLHLLKVHLPYHESDHVLNMAYNLLAGGTCLEDLELWRNDEVYLDALGGQRIPDPTTAGDFCRRFDETDVETLMNIINDVRVKVWRQQPASFLEETIIEGDGTMIRSPGSVFARNAAAAPRLLTPFGCIGLGIERHHARRRGRRWMYTASVPFKLCDPCILFGNAFGCGQKCQNNDFGIVLAESQRPRPAEFTAYRRVD